MKTVHDLTKTVGALASPVATPFDLNPSVLASAAASGIGDLGSANLFEPSPAALGHLWSKPDLPNVITDLGAAGFASSLPATRMKRLHEHTKTVGAGATPVTPTFDINQSVRATAAAARIGDLGSANRWKSSPAALGHLWSKPDLPKAITDFGVVGVASSLPAARMKTVHDLTKTVGALASPVPTPFDINQSVLASAAAGGIGGLGFRPSPAALGHLWSKPAGNFFETAALETDSTILLEEPETDDIAGAAWMFAERVGQWAQSLPDVEVRNTILHLGGVLISIAATAVAMEEGGPGSAAVAAGWMIFSVAMWINSLIDKIQS